MLMQLKIDWAISEYSYVEPSPLGDLYWLEEDCDAPLFLEKPTEQHVITCRGGLIATMER